jgi:hypothetical protein
VNTPGGPVSRTIPGRSQPHDAHNWLRNDDRRPSRPRGRAEYGQKSVQEIGGGTGACSAALINHSIGCVTAEALVRAKRIGM